MNPSDLRSPLLAQIQRYLVNNTQAQPTVDLFREFVLNHPNCFSRELGVGHITASAWVVNSTNDSVLLVHHKKLGRWLQPGGHCDGDCDTLAVARKELLEESGLGTAALLHDGIFDLDIHQIPKRGNDPEHLHYDVRYCFVASNSFVPECSHESNSVSWVFLAKLSAIANDESVLRMATKTNHLLRITN